MFIDEIKVTAKAGHGGAGCVAFHREAFRPKGGPSGGNGGQGGSVILEASHDINNLLAQFYQPRLFAESGKPGMGKRKNGRAGKDMIIKVPCGTIVWEMVQKDPPLEASISEDGEVENPLAAIAAKAGEVQEHDGNKALKIDLSQEAANEQNIELEKRLVTDLTTHGQRFVLCAGGRGGLGNMNFATPRRQAPRFAQPGEPGSEGQFLFELQILAEIGLVGYPNAGKSTLLTAISKARPKVAPYPFTTLHPQIGIVEFENFERLTVCDIPGLIEGAHNNVGLGHQFLRHIQRCKVLVLLIDLAGTDNRKPWGDYRQLRRELELYDPAMLEKKHIIVGNKIDEEAAVEYLKEFKKKIKGSSKNLLTISAAFDEGIEKFKQVIYDAVKKSE